MIMSEKHNEKKRKRQTGGDERPSKKPPTEVPAQTVKVSVLKDTNAELGPVIGMHMLDGVSNGWMPTGR